jgi:predicted ATPase
MEDLRIKRLVLKEVGVFNHLDVSFPEGPGQDKAEIHIFAGENGTGKTTLMQALTCFAPIRSAPPQPKQMGGSGIVLKLVSKSTIKLTLGNKELFFREKSNLQDSPLGHYFLQKGSSKSSNYHAYNFFAYDGYRKTPNARVEAFKNIEFDPIEEGIFFEKSKSTEAFYQWIANNKTRAALAFQDKNEAQHAEYAGRTRQIEEALTTILGKKIGFIVDIQSLNLSVRIDDRSVPFGLLAAGYQSVIGWLADLLFRLDVLGQSSSAKFSLFLDEIDIHLHPKAQRKILPAIQKLFPNAQIFITTHSPFVIGSVDDAWVYKFKLNDEGNAYLEGGKPTRSEDAQSYRHILEEVFDIREQFGIGAEAQLDAFYALRQQVLSSPNDAHWAELNRMGDALAKQSVEMAHLVNFELRQAGRILQKEVTI